MAADEITARDAWRYAREQAALLLDTDLTHEEVTEAAWNLASAFRDLDTGTVTGSPVGGTRHVRYHSADDMTGLGEFENTAEPVAVVLRADGSVDVYGHVAVIDQTGARVLDFQH